jgi:hypothetical protein
MFTITCITTFAQSQISAEARLREKHIILPAPPNPVGNYVEAVRVGNLRAQPGSDDARRTVCLR